MTSTAPATKLYLLPSLGADMDEGRIVEWKVGVGDVVRRGDVLASVETEKSDIDIEVWTDGVVEEFLVEVGALVAVGTPVLRLRTTGEEGAEPGAAGARQAVDTLAEMHPPAPLPAPVAVPAPVAIGAGPHVRASPRARRAATVRGVDLQAVTGSGPGGAVTYRDVVESLEDTPVESVGPDEPVDPIDRMRQLIARRMAVANAEIPHYYLERAVDLWALMRWLEQRNLDRGIAERLVPAAAFVRAVALAAAAHGELNGAWVDGGFRRGDAVNVAMAVSLRRGGLVTPVIADTDHRSVDEIMAALRELVAASRSGSLRASWMTGATITVTNLGEQGADLVHGVISPPQVALVGFGRVAERPWAVDGQILARPVVTVTLAADHRATDGAVGSRLLATIANLLEHPEEL